MFPKRLEHRYRPLRPLGAGGMGAVFVAEDLELGREVAIKLVVGTEDRAEALRARFAAEARALSRLEHPHVLRLLDFGEVDGLQYLVTELLDGTEFARLPPTTDPRPGWFQVGEGLQAAHEADLLHRDVKLANALLVPGRGGILIDFGLALVPDVERWTKTGAVVGSTVYMAPELICEGRYSRASDWYAWGVGLYTLLEGRAPFPVVAVMQGRVPEPEFTMLERGDPARELLVRLLATDPRRRPGSWGEVRAGLEGSARALMERWRAPARAFVRPGASGADPARRGRGMVAAAAVVAAGLLVGALARDGSPPAPVAPPTARPVSRELPQAFRDLDKALGAWEVSREDLGYHDRTLVVARQYCDPRGPLLWARYRRSLAATIEELALPPGRTLPDDWRDALVTDLVPRVLLVEDLAHAARWTITGIGGGGRWDPGKTRPLGREEQARGVRNLEEIETLDLSVALPPADERLVGELRLVLAGSASLDESADVRLELARRFLSSARREYPAVPRDGLVYSIGRLIWRIREDEGDCRTELALRRALRSHVSGCAQLPARRAALVGQSLLQGMVTLAFRCPAGADISDATVDEVVDLVLRAQEHDPWLVEMAQAKLRGMAGWHMLLGQRNLPSWYRPVRRRLAEALGENP